jgi:hypothetical protein
MLTEFDFTTAETLPNYSKVCCIYSSYSALNCLKLYFSYLWQFFCKNIFDYQDKNMNLLSYCTVRIVQEMMSGIN